jgi:ribosomal protein S18 acetylase RimI-like enzyme
VKGAETEALVIRRCRTEDARAVATLGARLFVQAYGATHPEPELSRYLAHTYSVETIAAAIDGEGSSVLLVEDRVGVPIGYAHISVSGELPAGVTGRKGFEIVRFYVDKAAQGRGVGATLMEQCCDLATSAGGDVVWLQVWSQAPWAVRFYERVGFAIVGKRPFYFGERVDEDHVMARAISR